MKQVKQSLFALAASFVATASFAQVSVGITNSTHASVTKAINASAATNAAAHAAAATRITTAATTRSAAQASTSVKNTATQNSDANVSTRVNAQAPVHASENATQANDNAAVLGTKTDGAVTVNDDMHAHVNGKPVADNAAEKTSTAKDETKAAVKSNIKGAKDLSKEPKVTVKAESTSSTAVSANQ